MSADDPLVRYPKRKRHTICYSEPADDEDLNLETLPEKNSTPEKATTGGKAPDADPSDDDFELGQRKKKKVKLSAYEKRMRDLKAKQQKEMREKEALRKMREQPFRFMDLPAEMRNAIYKMCLVDPGGLHITANRYQNSVRRRAVHCSPYEATSPGTVEYLYRFQASYEPEPWKVKPKLVPQLLATCKTIYAEAAGFFYRQPFIVQDSHTLQQLLLGMGPNGVAKLTNLTIGPRTGSRSSVKASNLPAFALLRDATSLEKLHVRSWVGWYKSHDRRNNPAAGEEGDEQRAKMIARNVYRDCWPWLEMVVNKDTTEGLKKMEQIFHIGEINFRPQHSKPDGQFKPEREAKMRGWIMNEVFRLLIAEA